MTDAPLNSDQLDKLQEIGSELAGQTNLDELCWSLTSWISDLTALEDCVVYVRIGNILTQMAALGGNKEVDGSIISRIGLPLGVGIVGSVALSGHPEYVPDIRHDDRYVFDEYPGASEFASPILHRGEVVGVIDVEHPDVDGIADIQQQLIQTISVLAAPHLVALLRLAGGSDIDHDYDEVIAELARLPAIAQGNLRQVFANLTERAARVLRCSRANIWLVNAEQTQMTCIDCYDMRNKQHTSGEVISVQQFPCYFQALHDERVIIARDALTDDRTGEFSSGYLLEHGIRAMLDAPIRQDGKVVGVLCVEHTGDLRDWSTEEANFVGTLSGFATIAIITQNKTQTESALFQAQKMESLGRLAGGIAHDFNNLLTVISGAVETLELKIPKDESTSKMLGLIANASDRASELTANLMAFVGKQQLVMAPFSLQSLTDKLLTLTQPILGRHTALSINLDTDVQLNGDYSQLEQVLLNLIINAVDAMPNGGNITINGHQVNENQIRISVSDTGVGMTPEIRAKIFDPFYTTKGDAGLGLGLSICQGIIAQHHGTMACMSTPGTGTTFEITLPCNEDHKLVHAPPPVPDESPAPSTSGSEILLVEDEIGVRNVVSQMLTALGFEPRVAENAEDALRILNQEPVDLLLSDVIMPDMRGPDLYEHAIKIRPELSALFVSGYTEEVIQEVPIGKTRVGYLGKPFTMQELREALNQVMSTSV